MNRLCSRYAGLFKFTSSYNCSLKIFSQQIRYKSSSDYDFKPLTTKGSIFVHPSNLASYKTPGWREKFFHKADDVDFMEWMREGMMKISYNYDVSPESFNKYLLKNRFIDIRHKQSIDPMAVEYLGVDLAVAHMVLGIGGSVKVVNSDGWTHKVKGQESTLPRFAVRNFQLEGIDLTGTHIMYEGLEFLVLLKELKFLRLRRCPFVTDHCVSRLTQLSESLMFLDLSNCKEITSRGISTLWPLSKLRRLLLSGNPFLEDKELVCLLLEEKLPNLYVEGVDFLEPLSADRRQAVLAATADDLATAKSLEAGCDQLSGEEDQGADLEALKKQAANLNV